MEMRQLNRRFSVGAGVAGLLLVLAATAGAATYEIDKAHSSVTFTIRHMTVNNVHGQFGDFTSTFNYDPADMKQWSCEATIQAASINTGTERRDNHLRSADFFDVANFPTITFKSTGITKEADGSYQLAGDLTMHGVTKPVVLALEVNGEVKDQRGSVHAGFSASGKLNRKDFGLVWNRALETGGFLVGDDVAIQIDVEGIAKAQTAP
jgi:polyisoprenoid-binding protein YceI